MLIEHVSRTTEIPEHYRVETMATVGRERDPRELDPETRRTERPSGRKAFAAIASAGMFPQGWS